MSNLIIHTLVLSDIEVSVTTRKLDDASMTIKACDTDNELFAKHIKNTVQKTIVLF